MYASIVKASLKNTTTDKSPVWIWNRPISAVAENLMAVYISKYPNQIDIIDSDEYYDLYHYNDKACMDACKIRGWIVERSSGIISAFGIPKIDEFVQDKYPLELTDANIYPMYECVTLRLWWNKHTNKWHLSTNRKLNAFESRWGSSNISFGDHFNNNMLAMYNRNVDDLTDELDKNHTYVYFQTFDYHQRLVRMPNTEDPVTYRSHKINNYTGVCDYSEKNGLFEEIPQVKTLDWNSVDVGFYIVTINGFCFKYLKEDYYRDQQIRGNDPDVIHRYFVLINENRLDEAHRLRQLFEGELQTCEYFLTEASKNIVLHHNEYTQKGVIYNIPKPQYDIYKLNKKSFFNFTTDEEKIAYARLLINSENSYNIYKSQKKLMNN